LFKLHISFFQKELVLGRRVGAKLLASIDELLCTNPDRFFKNLITLPLSAARYKLSDFISLLGIVNTFVCHIIAFMMIQQITKDIASMDSDQ